MNLLAGGGKKIGGFAAAVCWLSPAAYSALLLLLSFRPPGNEALQWHVLTMQLRLRVVALSCALVAAAALVLRREIQSSVVALCAELSDRAAHWPGRLRAAVREDGTLHWVALLLLLLLGLGLRLAFLDQPMRYDEAATFSRYASRPLSYALSHYYPQFNNHLLFTLLAHLCTAALGVEPWIIRLPALLAGTLIPLVVYGLTRQCYNRHSALLACGLTAASTVLITFSTNGRGYSMVGLFFLLLLLLAPLIVAPQRRIALYSFGLIATLGLYTIVIMLLPFGIVLIWVVLLALLHPRAERGRQATLAGLVPCLAVSAAATYLAYTPVIIGAGLSSIFANPFIAPKDLEFLLSSASGFLAGLWNQWNLQIPAPLRVALMLGVALSCAMHRRISRFRPPLLLAVLLGSGLLVLLRLSLGHFRIWMFLLPLYFTLAAAGLLGALGLALGKRKALFSGLAVGLSLSLSLGIGWGVLRSRAPERVTDTGVLADAGPIAECIAARLQPGDAVLAVVPSDLILEYYFNKLCIPSELLIRPPQTGRRLFLVTNLQEPLGRSADVQRLLRSARLTLATPSPISRECAFPSGELYLLDEPRSLRQLDGYIDPGAFTAF